MKKVILWILAVIVFIVAFSFAAVQLAPVYLISIRSGATGVEVEKFGGLNVLHQNPDGVVIIAEEIYHDGESFWFTQHREPGQVISGVVTVYRIARWRTRDESVPSNSQMVQMTLR
jgi:hypothetical protein